jgi:hypothetical protein
MRRCRRDEHVRHIVCIETGFLERRSSPIGSRACSIQAGFRLQASGLTTRSDPGHRNEGLNRDAGSGDRFKLTRGGRVTAVR